MFCWFCSNWWNVTLCCWIVNGFMIMWYDCCWVLLKMSFHGLSVDKLILKAVKCCVVETWCVFWKLIDFSLKLFWWLWEELIWCVWALGHYFNGFGKWGNQNKHFLGDFEGNPRPNNSNSHFSQRWRFN